MSRLILIFLFCMSLQATAQGRLDSCKAGRVERFVGGFCRSWKFGVTIANEVLYMIGLHGGQMPGDDNSNYNLSLIPSGVPSLKDQALWPNRRNTTLYSYGGRGASNISADEGAWTYTLGNAEWELQSGSVKPVGGYQSSNTTPSITDNTKEHTTVMLQFNTTTGEFSQLDAPFTPVQEGALVYVPNRRLGTLIYFGGEVPSEQTGIDATLTPVSQVFVCWISRCNRFRMHRTTCRSMVSRRKRGQFCAAVMRVINNHRYLSISSFKWYTPEGLTEGRMSPTCEAYGRQIFGIGAPTFIYNAQTEAVTDQFDPSLPVYSIPSALAEDIRATPTPSQWSGSDLAFLFYAPLPTGTYLPTVDDSPNKGAITGGTVGGVAGVAIIAAAAWFFRRA
ncbi:hypothetical protein BJX68DRAFT_278857 [Aspergillus pseudodeflectus]|uniref:Uncharacterized protein n=1 Tax=Aspergillus pseudodeflectus TaxID=176178 RepID=A0ABR4JLM2_9EURO